MNKKFNKNKLVTKDSTTEASGFIVAGFDNNYIVGTSTNGFTVFASKSAGELSVRIAYENDDQLQK
ncbi:hypothetical protein [Nitrosomonas supralitoralis]|uniref:Uncharacterized protein n=1 Tax=Nitrosomonas supralitoralis TaxID=2116706 RepID=A0A2P7NU74_9PROT|nr:hypothetical protein [Nitrosomonas supralitoralis]PSJ16989.1 hypothetical protein C7H79_10530 [Nitrosomonas supralitoralis]